MLTAWVFAMHATRLQAADHPPPPRGLDAGIGRPVADRVAWFRMWLYCLTALSDGVLSHATAVRGATMKELKVTLRADAGLSCWPTPP